MAKLSSRRLSEGERHVVNRDLAGLIRWARALQIMTLDLYQLEMTYNRHFLKADQTEALRQFRHYFGEVDPAVEFRVWRNNLVRSLFYAASFAVSVYWLLFNILG
ncbi:MAG: hypothetical protein ACTS8S_00865 [Giesbergeria sp.]